MDEYIVLPSGEKLYNGAIVLLNSSITQKYILHFGLYSYQDEDRIGPYFVSIPDKSTVVPAEGEFLTGIVVLSNGSSYFPPSPPPQPDPEIDIATDDKSIEISDNKLKLKDFLTKYYKIEDGEQVEVEGFSDNLRPIIVQDEDSYKLAWIQDERVQDITYGDENAENEYPSVAAVLQDKLLSFSAENIVPEDLPKNVTLNALLGYENKNRVNNPNLWELSPGLYLCSGDITITENDIVLPMNNTSVYVFINRIREEGQEEYNTYTIVGLPEDSGLYPIFGIPVGVVYGSSKSSTEGTLYGAVDIRMVTLSFDGSSADNEHIPTTEAVKDYVDNLIAAINGGSY